MKTLHNNIEMWISKKPQNIAITKYYSSTNKSITYKELEDLVQYCAAHFIDMGLNKGDFIMTGLVPDIEYAAIHIALFKLGIIPLIIDPGVS